MPTVTRLVLKTSATAARRLLPRRSIEAAAASRSSAATVTSSSSSTTLPPPLAATGRLRRRRRPPPSLRRTDGVRSWSEYERRGREAHRVDAEGSSARLRVRSVHAANSFDVESVLSKVFVGGMGKAPRRPLRHMFGRTSVIIQLPPASPSPSPPRPPPSLSEDVDTSGRLLDDASGPSAASRLKFVAVFRFGSVVFFNVSSDEVSEILDDIKRHGGAEDPVSTGSERREKFEVVVSPDMEGKAHANGDYATVRDLDMNSVAVISKVMAQTVALDSYRDVADELLAVFANINSSVRETGGSFADRVEKEGLFKMVARNNSLFIDMIARLGIKDRSDTAWNLSRYERMWEDMREEFEIDKRFGQIEFKLDLIQQNAKFFVSLLHHQKTNSLDWIIIVLIAFEGVLMCLDMSGMGEVAFSSLFEKFSSQSLPPKK